MKSLFIRTYILLLVLTPIAGIAAGVAEMDEVAVETVVTRAERLINERVAFYRENEYQVLGHDDVYVVTTGYEPTGEKKIFLFYPPETDYRDDDTRYPVMLFPIGMRDEELGARPAYVIGLNKLAEEFAVNGVVAVIYDAVELTLDFERVMEFLISRQEELRLDTDRFGLFAYSGHGRFTSRIMVSEILTERLRTVVFINADSRPISLPGNHVAFFLGYPHDSSEWERYGKALRIRVERAGHPLVAEENGPVKLLFGTKGLGEETLGMMALLKQFLEEYL